jgi:hypothetical protein
VMTVHSASVASPAARGTPYSASRMGLEAGRLCHRSGSVQRRNDVAGGPTAPAPAPVPVEALPGTAPEGPEGGDGEGGEPVEGGGEVAVGLDEPAVELSSAGLREQAVSAATAPIVRTK